VHVADTKVPVLLVVNATVPVGTTAPVPEESATVAVQLTAVLSGTLTGVHATVVVVARLVDASVKVPTLELWLESPP
jgi:hypothetical protein